MSLRVRFIFRSLFLIAIAVWVGWLMHQDLIGQRDKRLDDTLSRSALAVNSQFQDLSFGAQEYLIRLKLELIGQDWIQPWTFPERSRLELYIQRSVPRYLPLRKIRYLDEQGQEMARLDFYQENGGLAEPVDRQPLLDQSSEYFVYETLAMDPHAIYVSDVELMRPPRSEDAKPVVHLAIRSSSAEGLPPGLLAITLSLEDVIEGIPGLIDEDLQVQVFNEKGYWLLNSESPEKTWGNERDNPGFRVRREVQNLALGLTAERPWSTVGELGRLTQLQWALHQRAQGLYLYLKPNATFEESYQRSLWSEVILPVALLSVLLLFFLFRLYQREVDALDYQAQLESKNAELQKKDAFRSQFLANMSHEIRTPMTGILGLIELFRKNELSEDHLNYLARIKASGETLKHIIDDILDISKIEAGRLQLNPQDTPLLSLLDRAVNLYAPLAQAKKLDLRLIAAEDLPGVVTVDEIRVLQVLNNLMSNAVKFTHDGEVTLRVEVLARNDGMVTLDFCVRDTGIGIPLEVSKTILQPFEQADISVTRKYGGTGLGLTICQNLLKLMDSQLEISSVPGAGSEFGFQLRLPYQDLPRSVARDTRPDDPAAGIDEAIAPDFSGKGYRVLVVEDNETNQLLIGQLLENAGLQYTVAPDGQACLDQIKTQRYDLVLMDMQMPVMGGVEATRRLRLEYTPFELPIVALTAAALPENREEALQAGCNEHLAKPIDFMAFYREVSHWLEGREPVNGSPPEGGAEGTASQASAGMELSGILQDVDADKGFDLSRTVVARGAGKVYPKLLAAFFRDFSAYAGRAMDLLSRPDEAAAVSHKLKSAAANIGAENLRHLAETVDADLRKQSSSAMLKGMAEELERVLARIGDWLEQLD